MSIKVDTSTDVSPALRKTIQIQNQVLNNFTNLSNMNNIFSKLFICGWIERSSFCRLWQCRILVLHNQAYISADAYESEYCSKKYSLISKKSKEAWTFVYPIGQKRTVSLCWWRMPMCCLSIMKPTIPFTKCLPEAQYSFRKKWCQTRRVYLRVFGLEYSAFDPRSRRIQWK